MQRQQSPQQDRISTQDGFRMPFLAQLFCNGPGTRLAPTFIPTSGVSIMRLLMLWFVGVPFGVLILLKLLGMM